MVRAGPGRALHRLLRRRRRCGGALRGVGAARATRVGVRARWRRPRPLVDPRGRPLRPRLPGAGAGPVGPRRQRPPGRVPAHRLDRRGHRGGRPRWRGGPGGGRGPQHGRLRHHRHRRAPSGPAGGRHRVRLAGDRARRRDRRRPGRQRLRGAPHLRQRGRGPGPLPHRAAAGPLSPVRPRPRGPPLAAPGRGRLALEVRPPGVRPPRRGHALGGPALPVPGPLPAGAAPLRARAGHRGHRRRHVRPAGPGGAGHRDRRGRPPRHARPAAPAAHRAAHAGRRLGPAQNRRSDAPL